MMEKSSKDIYGETRVNALGPFLGKNNFIFLLGNYNLLLRKKGQFVLKRLLCKNEVYLFIKEYYKRRTKLFLYR